MRRLLLLLLLSLLTALHAEDALPPPPPGFTWQRLPSIKGGLLRPDGWFYKEAKQGHTEGFFITQEDIDKEGEFKTGRTLNCMRDIPKRTGKLPSVFALGLADEAAATHRLVERSSRATGLFKAVRFQYIDAPPGKESVTIWNLLMANDKTGTLFLYIFEAPTASWEKAWKTGDVILKRLFLDDEV